MKYAWRADFKQIITLKLWLSYLLEFAMVYSTLPGMKKKHTRSSRESFSLTFILKILHNWIKKSKCILPQTSIQCSRTVTSNPIFAGVLFSGSVEALAAVTRKEKSALSAAQKGNDCSLLPLLDYRTGCQWHRQCAFVYVLRTSVPSHITHKPQRGGLVCVCVCVFLSLCVYVWAIDWCVIWE